MRCSPSFARRHGKTRALPSSGTCAVRQFAVAQRRKSHTGADTSEGSPRRHLNDSSQCHHADWEERRCRLGYGQDEVLDGVPLPSAFLAGARAPRSQDSLVALGCISHPFLVRRKAGLRIFRNAIQSERCSSGCADALRLWPSPSEIVQPLLKRTARWPVASHARTQGMLPCYRLGGVGQDMLRAPQPDNRTSGSPKPSRSMTPRTENPSMPSFGARATPKGNVQAGTSDELRTEQNNTNITGRMKPHMKKYKDT